MSTSLSTTYVAAKVWCAAIRAAAPGVSLLPSFLNTVRLLRTMKVANTAFTAAVLGAQGWPCTSDCDARHLPGGIALLHFGWLMGEYIAAL